VPWVRVPAVEWGLTSPTVLTLEYLPGVKITDVVRMRSDGLDQSLVARRATEAYLLQTLSHGFFHADPHVRGGPGVRGASPLATGDEAVRGGSALPCARSCALPTHAHC